MDLPARQNALVETRYGKLQGTHTEAVSVWKGIPYAQAPLGELRFRAPQAPTAWSGVRDATTFGLTAPQGGGLQGMLATSPEPSGEDCLFLNIWSPAADDQRRPVLFWIHGGAFVLGSGSIPWYDGSNFAVKGDVVVVTINYRLGALGFLHLSDIAGADKGFASNCGLLDQIAALQWVHDNITVFGGDPNNITIFGESAGAMSIGSLLAMPTAQGLFHKAILQSGASHTVQSRENATIVARAFLEQLGVKSLANDLASASLERIQEARKQASTAGSGMAFQPAVDGVTLAEPPIQAVARGSAHGVTLLIGTNRDEMRLFTAMDPNQAIFKMRVFEKLFGTNAQTALATYQAAQAKQSTSDTADTTTTTDAWLDFLTDQTFRIPAIRLAETQAAQGDDVWMYRFDWPSPVFAGNLKACHALEIPFVWDNLNQPGATMLTGDSPNIQKIADAMHAAWIAFAHNGNPSTSALPDWPAYDSQQRATMLFNETCQRVNDPQAAERQLWQGIL